MFGNLPSYVKIWINCCFLFMLITQAQAQTIIVKDSVSDNGTTVVYPGLHYKKSGFHNFVFGRHYRPEWATPIRVNNFYIDTAKGGLQIIKESGSRQSEGLRLQSKSGRQYVLRSVDKDFGQGFAKIYQHTFITNIAKDQASFGYPGAAITVTPMIAAAGIYHTNPVMVFLPKQNALNEYNSTHGDQLYLFEERPDDDQHDAPWFGNSKNVIGTEKLYEKIYGDNDNQVDQTSFAKARLFDMLIGDWGRHDDQWRWAGFNIDKKTTYKPIPRDRDQAYTKFDGLLPWIATNIAGGTHLESFSNNIKNIGSFNKPGRGLDNHFTNNLTKEQWIAAASDLRVSITDAVIENGIQQLPAALYNLKSSTVITAHLKSRRDKLQDFASRYYSNLAKKTAVYGTDKSEYFEINRVSANETSIKVYKINKKGNIEAEPFYARTFFTNETKELRLYGFKDEDIFSLKGNAGQGVKVRIIGFTKKDSLVKNTAGKDSKTKLHRGGSELYDTVFQKKIKISPVILVTPPIYQVFDDDVLDLFTRPGLRVGLNFIYRPKVWKRDADEPVHNLSYNYGFIRKSMYVNYVGLFPHAFGKWDFLLKAKYDFTAAENFYGIGNETKDSTGTGKKYYNVFSRRFYAGAGVNLKIGGLHQVDASLFYQDIKINRDSGSFIQDKQSMLPVFTSKKFAGLVAGYNYRNVNYQLIPTKGIDFKISAGYITGVENLKNSFFKGMSAFSFYIPIGKVLGFASRVGGASMTGDAPYYYLNKLGGNENLRGYTRERFYGKTSFYNNNEIRLIGNVKTIVFNGKAGVFGFFDNGRVWQPGEKSNAWHLGYGAGVLISPFNKFVLIGTYGLSEDGYQILVKTRMFF